MLAVAWIQLHAISLRLSARKTLTGRPRTTVTAEVDHRRLELA
jgi:hypothetical protein